MKTVPISTVATITAVRETRHDWVLEEIEDLYRLPLMDLLYQAQSQHRQCFDPNQLQLSTLINIKTGGCAEDCAYCPQSARYETGVAASALLNVDSVREAALQAQTHGASRFCMGAAWRRLKDSDLPVLEEMVRAVKATGMETCLTVGMLQARQARVLKEAGLDYYNHNLDTSESYYSEIISTRTYQDRLQTLEHVREAGINVCCGGILGMGESRQDRCALLQTLANMPVHPQSVPINVLVSVEGTPLQGCEKPDAIEVIRCIAVARLMMPATMLRLSAGRDEMSDEMQALCFLAGANSVFYGERLLTTDNPELTRDRDLFERLGMETRT